jgi:membrane protease YdiL (CAAX protease family)
MRCLHSCDVLAMQKRQDLQGVCLFTLIAFVFSWSIFFVVDAWWMPVVTRQGTVAATRLLPLFGHMLAMAGPAIAALTVWRWFHHEPLPAWEWSHPIYYVLVVLAMLAIWTLPALAGLAFTEAFRLLRPIDASAWVVIGTSLTLGWLAGLGEEVGWTAYLLPRLAPHLGKTRALVVAGAMRGLWHWPVFMGPSVALLVSGDITCGRFAMRAMAIACQLLISNVFFGALFGWVWYKTVSMPLLGWLHQWYNTTRDVTSLLIAGYAGSVWFGLWALPFNLVAVFLLSRVAREEGTTLWQLVLFKGGNKQKTTA